MNKWKDIWEKREDGFDHIDMTDTKSVFLELKRIDGFDVIGGGIPYEELIKQNSEIIGRLSKHSGISSVFDVGCGCGANLYLFMNDGLKIGGIDYSTAQIGIARKIFKEEQVEELLCGEAKNMPTGIRYDAVVSNSVFSYFPDEEYAIEVLDKMLMKSEKSMALVDIHNTDKKDAFVEYRRKTVENYDEKYRDLHKFFYRKDFFSGWARRNDLEIAFYDSDIEGYWNNQFVFDVYFYRRY